MSTKFSLNADILFLFLAVEISNELLEIRVSRISLRPTSVADEAKKARAVGCVISKLLAVVQSTKKLFPVVVSQYSYDES